MLVEINKQFHDGTIRYEGDLENLDDKSNIVIARLIAERHPFIDGNKRTAIKYMEKTVDIQVPWFVYDILKRC